MKPRLDIPLDTLRRQAQASDPAVSAWASANAGAGKTHVLAQRVVRLLLEKFRPERILCLTFTKAAAANMAERVFRQLSEWSSLDDEALAEAIAATGAPKPTSAAELAFARKLFARAVETPGGLKIQTMHAFCERILHVAPFEANVAAGFSVIEESEEKTLVARAKADLLAQARRDASLSAALERIAEDAGLTFDDLLNEALRQRDKFRAAAGPGAEARLKAALGLDANENSATILRETLEGGLAPKRWPEIAAFMIGGKDTDQKRAARLSRAHENWRAGRLEDARDEIFAVFFNKSDAAPTKRLLTDKLAKSRPDILNELNDEQARLGLMREKQAAADAAGRSLALSLFVNAVIDRYEQLKSERQRLDFDDLIERTRELFERSSARWALQKLDAGIDHILVDEAQDLSAKQWEILDRISEDFFAGEGQSRRVRTFFAVGDEKQSIFSFQGAAPKLFAAMQGQFRKRAEAAERKFAPVELTLSFRSAQGVLDAVDEVFSRPEHYRGLSAQADHVRTTHEALKRNLPARVEIWDVIAPVARPEKRDWRLPLDYRDADDPPVASARRIATTIADWLAPGSGETVQDKGTRRPVRPGDIMILVRRRDAFFEAMIRALKEAKVPVAGADRLKLAEHIAVMDLVAIGRAALLPEDDLVLATALKTPIFGLDDDDLLQIAPRRAGSLHASLRASPQERHQTAAALLDLLRQTGRDLPPFAFYARLLGPRGGRRAFLARLGPEAGDAIDEFLNLALAHERARAPSLADFLAEVEALDLEIKRDMDMSASYVRVMTVHAAKGLESKIVFLPDVCAAPNGAHDGKLFALPAPDGEEVLAWSPKKGDDCAAIARARAAAREADGEEYRRLLYVAMTRAEERLYICGHRGRNDFKPESWRGMIEAALIAASVESPAPWGGDAPVWRYRDFPAPTPAAKAETEAAPPQEPPPAWLFAPAPAEFCRSPPLRPSSALEGAEENRQLETSLSPQRAEALEEGRRVHLLLQFLPDLAAPLRRDAALRHLEVQGVAPARARVLAERVLHILDDERLAPLFGENSVAEARVAARLEKAGGGSVDIEGAIDRLAETEEAIWLADYKTGAPRAEPAPAHVAQLALYRAAIALLYPGKSVRCLLIYASGPRVEEIAPQQLDAALAEALA